MIKQSNRRAQQRRNKITIKSLTDEGYMLPRQLPDGRWIGLRKMLSTVGLFVGLDETGYTHRYCYEHGFEAMRDVMTWDGKDDPPGLWIKRKGNGGDRLNPRWLAEARGEMRDEQVR